MRKWPFLKSKKDQPKKTSEIDLVKARTFELEPDKFYLAFINLAKAGLSKNDLENIRFPNAIQHPNLLWCVIKDDPNDVIEIIEAKIDD